MCLEAKLSVAAAVILKIRQQEVKSYRASHPLHVSHRMLAHTR